MHTIRHRAALLIILIVGALLRFQHFGDIEYNIDQVYPIWQGINTLDTGALPLAGQGTSVLFANPTLTGYFFIPVLALVRQPAAVYVFTLLLNTVAIWLAYRGLQALLGTRPALVGAALFAVNPWIIEDSRRTWVQSLSPFFACLIFYALAALLSGQTRLPRRTLLIALVGLALFANTYLLAYALAAPVALLLILFWRRVPKRPLIMGGILFAALLALYLIGLVRDWDNTSRRADDFASGQSHLSAEALNHGIRLVTGWQYAHVRGMKAPAHDQNIREKLSAIAHVIWTAALIAGILLALRAVYRRTDPRERDAALILLVWFVLPIVMMSYVSRKVHPFYLLLTVPAGHGLAAWGISPLLRRERLAPAVLAAVIFTGAINGLNTVRFAQASATVPSEDWPTMPLQEAAEVGERIRQERRDEMAVLSDMDEWTPVTLAGEVFRVETLSGFDHDTIIPRHGGLYMTFQKPGGNRTPPPLFAHPAGRPFLFDDGARVDFWAAEQPDAIIEHPADIPSDIDVSFAGWTQLGDLTAGQTVTLLIFWRVQALHEDRGIWLFAPYAHLFDANGTRVAITEGNVISALTWRPGDLLVQRLDLTVPADAAGPFTINVGLYDGVRTREDGSVGINAVFRIPNGAETTYSADLPIFSLDGE